MYEMHWPTERVSPDVPVVLVGRTATPKTPPFLKYGVDLILDPLDAVAPVVRLAEVEAVGRPVWTRKAARAGTGRR